MKSWPSYILLLLITAKVGLVLLLGPAQIQMDAAHYWRLSTQVLAGDLLLMEAKTAYRTPFYPWFIAIFRSTFSSHALAAIAIAQGLMYVAAAWIAGVIAKRIAKLELARVISFAIYLPAISGVTYCGTVLTEPLFVLLLMLHLLAVMDYAKYDSGSTACWAGITFALTLLTRPIVMLAWLPSLLFILLIHDRRRRRLGRDGENRLKLPGRGVHLTIAGMTVLLIVSPWLMRNRLMFGETFFTEFTGRNLWIVTYQDGSGAHLDFPKSESGAELNQRLSRVKFDGDPRATWSVSDSLVESGLSDPHTDRLMKQTAIDSITTNQSAFAYKAFRRVVNFWRTPITDLPVADPNDDYGQVIRWSYSIPLMDRWIDYRAGRSVAFNTLCLFLTLVSACYLIANRWTRPYGVWLSGILAYFCVVTGVIEIPAYRYRMVVEPIVATVIGSAAAITWTQWRAHRRTLLGLDP